MLAAGCGPRAPDVFTLGVASGDPWPTGVVLWTRLATDPLAGDGRGGMPDRAVEVGYQIAEDERFTRIVRDGRVRAAPEQGHSVHVEADGLRPGTEYFYRFRAGDSFSPIGRTRTAPERGSLGELTLCFASCANYGHGYFTAYRRLAEDEPELVLHLGDYVYETANERGDVREVPGPEPRTLAEYRLRHALYKTDPDLQLAHATAPWIVVPDDHEVQNDWTANPVFHQRRVAALQAYYENMPLRARRLYRRLYWGELATFHMLDTRQYRDDQACRDGIVVGCDERFRPERTMIGAEQERWLADGLRQSVARWDLIGQQVVFAEMDRVEGPARGYNTDAWDGYVANRERVVSALAPVRNAVVLTGDVHRHYAAELAKGVELITTSISSEGDGDEDPARTQLTENPHMKFYKNRRGYVRARITPSEVRADYRILPYVRRPGAAAETAASFALPDRDTQLYRI